MTKEELARLITLEHNKDKMIEMHAQILKKSFDEHKDEILKMFRERRNKND